MHPSTNFGYKGSVGYPDYLQWDVLSQWACNWFVSSERRNRSVAGSSTQCSSLDKGFCRRSLEVQTSRQKPSQSQQNNVGAKAKRPLLYDYFSDFEPVYASWIQTLFFRLGHVFVHPAYKKPAHSQKNSVKRCCLILYWWVWTGFCLL